ncbi:MAG: hypothetical protein KDB61_16520, partial [Planctomycetes bacterium]|nr:hypothetical protein [Planctomycetota bacterium]
EELDKLRPWIRDVVSLQRRGVDHGDWAILRPEAWTSEGGYSRDLLFDERWFEARPIPMPGFLGELESPDASRARYETLAGTKGLRALLSQNLERLGETFAPGSNMHLADESRDLERIKLGVDHDLWAKLGRLSNHKNDASLRLRFSFGKEREDDASRDIVRHRLVTEIAESLLPGARAMRDHGELARRWQRWVGGTMLPTQHIAYFNAPDGGALWHHDAF